MRLDPRDVKMISATGARIVLATFGSLGDVQPFLAIGRALRAKGHEVVIATSDVYRDQVAAASLVFAPVRPNRLSGQQDPDYLDRLFRGRKSPADIFRQMFLPALRESVEDMLEASTGANAVVTHPLASSGRLAAEVRQIPWISAVMQPMGYLSAHEPPVVGPSWIAAALRGLGPSSTRQLHRGARALTGTWSSEWHAIRDELGLPATSEHPLWDGQHSQLGSLGLFPGLLGSPQPDWPPQARVTGFPFYRAPGRELDTDLRQFLEAGDPPVVFTLGTTAVNDPGPFYEVSAEAVERLGLRAVMLTGPGSVDRLESWSNDVVAVPFAPHDLVFPQALAVVHQGGIGTLSEAMCARKPMLIMPYGHDQADNAWRASRLGIARVVPRRSYRSNVVRRALQALLEDTERSAATARVGQAIIEEHGAETAAEFIESSIMAGECTYADRPRPLLVCK